MEIELQKRILSSIILIPITFFFIFKGSLFFLFFISICFLVTSYEWHMMSKKKKYNIYGFIFLVISFYTAYLLRNLDSCCDLSDSGLNYFLLIVLICIFTDIGGYVFGKLFKGPKLTKISPKKTYAGVIGGFFLSIISIYVFLSYLFLNIEFTIKLIILILLISLVNQIGDILISYFKRLSNIKDTGKLIPGHGGLLDRIDGMIFAFPFTYLLLKTNLFDLF